MTKVTGFLLAAALWTGGAVAEDKATRVEGAGPAYLLMELAAKEFTGARAGQPPVVVGLTTTAGAITKLCRGELEVAAVLRPLSKQESAACGEARQALLEMPVAIDALVLVANPRNEFLQRLTREELERLWRQSAEGKVIRWRQVNAAWPDVPIVLYGADPAGGDARFFDEAVLGRGQRARADYTYSVDDGVLIRGIGRDLNALGYVAYPYYYAHRTKVKAVRFAETGEGRPVEPSPEAVARGDYARLSRPLLLYVRVEGLKRADAFLAFTLQNGERLARSARTVPLKAVDYQQALERLRARRSSAAPSGGEASVKGAGERESRS